MTDFAGITVFKEVIMDKKQKKYPFVDLTNDRAFKKYFSSDNEVLLYLLKAFLPLPDKKKVQSVEIIIDKAVEAEQIKQEKALLKNQQSQGQDLNNKPSGLLTGQSQAKSPKQDEKLVTVQGLTIKDSTLYPHSVGEKQVTLDLNVSLNTGEKVDVEMQVANQQHFSKRMVFYWAQLHSTGLKKSKDYAQLYPTYSLIFTAFPMFGMEYKRGVVTSCSIRSDTPPHCVLNNQLRMVVVELNRFKKTDIKKLLDEQEDWCYLLKESKRLTRKQASLLAEKGVEMKKAVGLLDNVSEGDLALLRRRSWERYQRDQRAIKAYAYDEGMEDGMEKGMEKERQTVILAMLHKDVDMAFISEITGLSVDAIKKLKNGSC